MEAMLETLSKLVSIKSVSEKGGNDAPFGENVKEALKCALEICDSLGFKTKNCDNKCGYAEIGEGETLIGILVHLDIVPAGDGWETDPYKLTEIDDKIFGRGVIDDKGPAVAAIYAMNEIKESMIELHSRIRIIFGCSEETGDWADIDYYKATEELPTMGFTPDADFPVVYGEMGIANVELKMKKSESGIQSISGGIAMNMVADKVECILSGDKAGDAITEVGKSAHGSMPWLGTNAISKLMLKIDCPLSREYNKYLGMTYDGKLLGCNFVDTQSGKLTVNPGMIYNTEEDIIIALDIRCPVTYSKDQLMNAINSRISNSLFGAELKMWEAPVYNDKDGILVTTLMEAYEQITGRDDKATTMGGGTYARAMDNIVAFGPDFPNRECTEHQPNEYIFKDDLIMTREIYTLALKKLVNML